MKHTVLITGGAGFIGSHLADKLSRIYHVVIIDNLSTGLLTNIQNHNFIKADVRKKHEINTIIKKYSPDVVLHLAGQASTYTSFLNPEYDIAVNFLGTVNVVNACITYNIPRVLYASSMTVYGNPKRLPVKESDPCVPISYYGISKYAAERFLMASPIIPTAFRMFNVYGPRQSLTNPYQGVMAIFMGNVLRLEPITIYGDGKQARDFIYIDDVVNAWLLAINNPKSYHTVLNLGAGHMTSIQTLVNTIAPPNYPIIYKPPRPGDQRFMKADMILAKKILNFIPETILKKGLKKTYEFASNKGNV